MAISSAPQGSQREPSQAWKAAPHSATLGRSRARTAVRHAEKISTITPRSTRKTPSGSESVEGSEIRCPLDDSITRRKSPKRATTNPNAISARNVRIHARNVRSAAIYTRGSRFESSAVVAILRFAARKHRGIPCYKKTCWLSPDVDGVVRVAKIPRFRTRGTAVREAKKACELQLCSCAVSAVLCILCSTFPAVEVVVPVSAPRPSR